MLRRAVLYCVVLCRIGMVLFCVILCRSGLHQLIVCYMYISRAKCARARVLRRCCVTTIARHRPGFETQLSGHCSLGVNTHESAALTSRRCCSTRGHFWPSLVASGPICSSWGPNLEDPGPSFADSGAWARSRVASTAHVHARACRRLSVAVRSRTSDGAELLCHSRWWWATTSIPWRRNKT